MAVELTLFIKGNGDIFEKAREDNFKLIPKDERYVQKVIGYARKRLFEAGFVLSRPIQIAFSIPDSKQGHYKFTQKLTGYIPVHTRRVLMMQALKGEPI
jgi:hypothetical protein